MNQPAFVKTKEGLYRVRGNVKPEDIIHQAANIMLEGISDGRVLKGSIETANFLHFALANELNERFSALFLNSQHQVLAFEHLFQGTINSAVVHPRVVAQRALALNAAAVIVAHNHPSNEPEPSRADIIITEKLKEGLSILDITLLDHFIVTRNNCVSLSERGLM